MASSVPESSLNTAVFMCPNKKKMGYNGEIKITVKIPHLGNPEETFERNINNVKISSFLKTGNSFGLLKISMIEHKVNI